jgi:hypothetical protein
MIGAIYAVQHMWCLSHIPVLCPWPCHPCVCCVPLPAAAHFARQREPKVLVTTCYKPSKTMFTFLAEMLVRKGGGGKTRQQHTRLLQKCAHCLARIDKALYEPCWLRCW